MAWKNYSRKCAYCGKAGPRTPIPGGWAHKRCLPTITVPKRTNGVKDTP